MLESDFLHTRLLTSVPMLKESGGAYVAIRSSDGFPCVVTREEALVLRSITAGMTAHEICILVTRRLLQEGLQSRFENHRWNGLPRAILRHYILRSPDTMMLHLAKKKGHDRHLDDLIRSGLLIEEREFIDGLASNPASPGSSVGDCFSILTSDRPKLLRRALESLVPHGKDVSSTKTSDRWFVMDDSRSETSTAMNRYAIRQLRTDRCVNLTHVKRFERHALIAALSNRTRVSDELLTFALSPNETLTTEGASRNTLMLLSAGRRVFQFDDDTYFDGSIATSSNAELNITNRQFPYEAFFASDIKAYIPSNTSRGLVEFHERNRANLGESVATLLRRSTALGEWPPVQSSAINYSNITKGRVGVTTMGSLGDPGTHSMGAYLLCLNGPSLARLCASADAYKLSITTRNVYRKVDSITLSREATLQSMTVAIDNRFLTPPFFPYGRNLDGLFIKTLLTIDPHVWVCHLPSAVCHHSTIQRKDGLSYLHAFDRVRINDLLILITQAHEYEMNTPADNLMSLGSHIEFLAGLNESDLRQRCTNHVVQRQLLLIKEVDQRLSTDQTHCAPYQKDLVELRENLLLSLRNPSLGIASDIELALSSSLAFRKFREALRLYGALLKVWPMLWEAAHDIDLGIF